MITLKKDELTTEGVVPPADGDSGALTGLSVGLHVVTESGLHAVVLAHVVHAVTQEGLGGHEGVAGLEAVREDDLGTLSLEPLLLLCGAVGVDIWTGVWLTARGESVWISGLVSPERQSAGLKSEGNAE